MAPPVYLSFRMVFLLHLAFFMLIISLLFCCASIHGHELQSSRSWSGVGRGLLELEEEDKQLLLKKKSSEPDQDFKNNQIDKIDLILIPKIKKLNSTTSKATNSSKFTKTSDLLKLSTSNNKTTTKTLTDSAAQSSKTEKKSLQGRKPTTQIQKQQASWMDEEDEADLVAEFRDLPTKFQENLIPHLERISETSRKILIFIQIYLSIYFSILCLTSLITGLEPLKFFYATSPSTYLCLQVLQTLGYVLYLLLLLMYLILVFSTDSGLGSKMLGLGQIFVRFAVGLHYYVAVFHRVMLHQPPRTKWKVHGMYATCFLVICLFARADRRKKAYLEEGGEEGQKN
ncbi:hypothetical protein F3Y22_tig00110330pilonHSYRG00257 [Hibiscus syriacus]|uniref:Transmembrane protein n=1 Tax=Hibiscus syriacus TaxID=106335 RepID=A0A6A3AY51_HIBSY|nr:hypothetical protein F3Y22_tig00110330pilonHSYRG00257 [Hibiscus syriacus]